MDPEEIATFFKLKSGDEFLLSLGSGEITINQIINRILDRPNNKYPQKPHRITVSSSYSIKVVGVGDLLTRIAKCCGPLPGEGIVGYITRTGGVTVHKTSCLAINRENELERLVAVEWGVKQELFPVTLVIEAEDRVGLLRDLSAKVSEEGINIGSLVTDKHDDGTATITLMIYTIGIHQLGRVFGKIEGIKGILSVARNNPGSSQEQKT
jgi:GTP pyrophosphokinase